MNSFPLRYPLVLAFKFFALAPQFSVTDADGRLIGWAAQKLFRLKEAVNVFSDRSRKETLYTINADRVMDFGARYNFSDSQGKPLGAVQRKGLKSIWKAQYDILDGSNVTMKIREENPWIKVIDGVIGIIPFADLFTGFFLHPAYQVSRIDGTVLMRMQKRTAFNESRFAIERLGPLHEAEEERALLSLIMVVLLERDRG